MSSSSKLIVGSRVYLDGEVYKVAGFDGPSVILHSSGGNSIRLSTAAMLGQEDFSVLDAEEREPSEPSFPDLLTDEMRREAREKLEHLREAQTGYRSGSAESAKPSEPRSEYDPEITTSTERMKSKAKEMGIGERTIWKMQKDYERQGLMGLADLRGIRQSNALGRLDPRVYKAIEEVLDDLVNKSSVTRERIRRLVQRRLDAEHGEGTVQCPKRSSFNEVLKELDKRREMFGSAKNRRNAARRPDTPYRRFNATRPGEYVQIDSTPLDAHALDPISYRWLPLQLTMVLDVFTRSIVAWRFTPRDANRVDAALVLYDVLAPKRMPHGWPEEARFDRRYTGIPENVIVELGAEEAAGVPVLNPETVVVDHGRIFLSQAFEDACARLGINIQYARPRTPTDKSHIERAFESVRTGFVQNLPGYKGPDLFSRGEGVESESFLFIDEIEELFAGWVATYWQARHHEGLSLSCSPKLRLSPNDMYDEGIARAGFLYVPPDHTIYYDLLPTEWRTVQTYGVDVRGLRYDGQALNSFRKVTSPYAGKHKGKWPIRYDPRDLSRVFFLDPDTGLWNDLYRVGTANPHTPFNEATLSYAKALVVERGGNASNRDDVASALDALVSRIEGKELHGKEERRLAARRALHADQARRDRGDASVTPLPGPQDRLRPPDEAAEMLELDPESVPIMPSVDDPEEDDDLGDHVEIFDDVDDSWEESNER